MQRTRNRSDACRPRPAPATLLPILAPVLLLAGCWGGGPEAPADPIPPISAELKQREEVIRQRFRAAEAGWNNGDFDTALAELREIARLDPHHPLASQGAVQIAMRRGSLDEAEGLILDLTPDSEPARRYGRGIVRLFRGETSQAENLLDTAAEEYSGLQHPAGLAASLTGLGIVASWTSRFEEAIGRYERALQIVERLGDRRSTSDLLVNLAGVRRELGDEEAALADFGRALSIQEGLEDRDGLSATLFNVGLVLIDRGEYDEAKSALGRALELNRELDDRASEGRTINAIARIDLERGSWEEAKVAFGEALGIALEFGDRQGEADAIANLGLIDLRLERFEKAVEAFLEALEIRRGLGDRAGEAACLHNIGVTQERVGETARALQSYEAALAIYRTIRSPRGEAAVLDSLGRLRTRLGDRSEGAAALGRAVELYRRIGSPRGEASASGALGEALIAAADYGGARGHLERALELWRALDDPAGQVGALRNLGVLQGKIGAYDDAIVHLEEARRRLVETSDLSAEADVMNDLGNVRLAQGDFTEALRLQHRSLRIRRELGERRGEATNLNNIGAIHRALGDPDRAVSYVRDSLQKMRELGDPSGIALARNNLGVLLEDAGDPAAALAEYRESIRIREELQDLRGSAFSRHNLAGALLLLGRADEAARELEESLRTLRVIGDRGAEALTLVGLGDLERDQGRLSTAVGRYEEALGLAQGAGMKEAIWRAEAGIAACMEAGSEWSQALKFYQRAIAGIESVRRDLVSDEFKTGFLSARVDMYERIVWLLRNHGHKFLETDPAASGFEFAERARARSLLDLLSEAGSDLRSGIDPQIVARESEIVARIAQLESDLHDPREEEERVAILRSMTDAEEELQLLAVEIRAAAPAYADINYPEPVSAEEVRESLVAEDEILIEYLLGEKASYVWAVRSGDIRWWELPARAEIEEAVRRLLGTLQSQAADLGAEPAHRVPARTLSDALLPEGMLPDRGRVLIVPDGILNYLPFETLIVGKGEGERYLVESHEISYAPSASALRQLRGRGPARGTGRLFALGDPPTDNLPEGWDVPPLPFAREEVSRIGRLFPETERVVRVGPEASETAVKSADLSSYRYLHFAVHGWIHEEAPVRSGIFLGRGEERRDDGLLRLNEIFRMRMEVDLVVLSGCRTGLGPLVRGEGMVGFSRALFYSGARSVVVSLWNVNDRSTAALMEAMYGRLVRGEYPAAALRQAKLAMIRSENPGYRHPSRWASFILTGDPGRPRERVPGAGSR